MKKLSLTEATCLLLEENEIDFDEIFTNIKDLIKNSFNDIKEDTSDFIELNIDDSYARTALTRRIKKYLNNISGISYESEREPNTRYSSNGYYIGTAKDGYSSFKFYYDHKPIFILRSRSNGNYSVKLLKDNEDLLYY